MTRRFTIVHRTSYAYSSSMADGYTIAVLLPRPTTTQTVVESGLSVQPLPDEFDESTDPFGNRVVRFAVHRPHDQLTLVATSLVDVDLPDHVDGRVSDGRGGGPIDNDGEPDWFYGASELVPLDDPEVAAAIGALVAPLGSATTPVEVVERLCTLIFESFQFDAGFSDVTTPLIDVLAARRGVCQDFAHVAIGCLRHLGIPARYISGYIETVAPPGETKLVGADASHAWCAAWISGTGWVAFDPTNNQLPPLRHVVVGWGRDYADLPPVRGVVIGPPATQHMSVAVDVVSEIR